MTLGTVLTPPHIPAVLPWLLALEPDLWEVTSRYLVFVRRLYPNPACWIFGAPWGLAHGMFCISLTLDTWKLWHLSWIRTRLSLLASCGFWWHLTRAAKTCKRTDPCCTPYSVHKGVAHRQSPNWLVKCHYRYSVQGQRVKIKLCRHWYIDNSAHISLDSQLVAQRWMLFLLFGVCQCCTDNFQSLCMWPT